jgi:hypothetical protein
MADFIKIATYPMLPEAQIALGRLAAEGIDATLADSYLTQVLPGTVLSVGLLVAPEDESAALRILATDYSSDLDTYDETT